MGKAVHNDVLDGALLVMRSSADKMVACSAEPVSFAEADGALKLAQAPMTPSDYALSDGVTSGRRLSVAEKSGAVATASGTANHVALLDTAGSRLLYVTTCAAQALSTGQTVTFGPWEVEIADPV